VSRYEHGSSVGVEKVTGRTVKEFKFDFRQGRRFQCLPQRPDRLRIPPSRVSNGYPGLFPLGVRRPGHDNSPLFSKEFKNE
jgi:hypothetical protein